MTFILGTKCGDGIALFADTLESGSVVNRYRLKLHSRNFEDWGMAWGIAGNAHVADKLTDKLKTIRQSGSYDRQTIELLIEQCIKWVRGQYTGTGDDVEIIVGLYGRPTITPKGKTPYLGIPELHLYRGESLTACLAPVRDYCIAGMDVTLAAFILENARNPFGMVAEAKRLGILITALMKRYASGVGGDTNALIYTFGLDGWIPMLSGEVESLEKTFPITEAERAMSLFWINHPQARNNIEINKSEIDIKKAMRPIPKPSTSRRSKRKR